MGCHRAIGSVAHACRDLEQVAQADLGYSQHFLDLFYITLNLGYQIASRRNLPRVQRGA